jgi:hypothetical protein
VLAAAGPNLTGADVADHPCPPLIEVARRSAPLLGEHRPTDREAIEVDQHGVYLPLGNAVPMWPPLLPITWSVCGRAASVSEAVAAQQHPRAIIVRQLHGLGRAAPLASTSC